MDVSVSLPSILQNTYYLYMTTTNLNKNIKPKFTKIKVDPMFTISYTVIGIHFKFPEVEHPHLDAKSDLLFLSKTDINNTNLLQE